jgi:hypothetical protein
MISIILADSMIVGVVICGVIGMGVFAHTETSNGDAV